MVQFGCVVMLEYTPTDHYHSIHNKVVQHFMKHVFLCDSFILSCGVDPHSCADCGGDPNRLLLHNWTDVAGSHSLLHPGLEVANPGCVFALLRLFPHLMVRGQVLNCIEKLNFQ